MRRHARFPVMRLPTTARLAAVGAALALGGAQLHADGMAPAALQNPLAVHSLDEFTATRERPLFAPDRRPPAPPPVVRVDPQPVDPKPVPPSLVLLGVLLDAGQPSAVVRGAPSEKTVRVRVGDELDGWKIAQIAERQLVLARDDRSVTFTMFDGKNAGERSPVIQYTRAARVLELNPAGVLTARHVTKPAP
jgi:hypothetical protein